jgi:hypothetical protein
MDDGLGMSGAQMAECVLKSMTRWRADYGGNPAGVAVSVAAMQCIYDHQREAQPALGMPPKVIEHGYQGTLWGVPCTADETLEPTEVMLWESF